MSFKLDHRSFIYTPYYCEENIWQLCKGIFTSTLCNKDNDISYYVVFITNNLKQVPIWTMTCAKNNDIVIWDYHVILVNLVLYYQSDNSSKVYDFDTTLEFGCNLEEYFQKALKNENNFPDKYKRKYRIIPGKVYLDHFASDRSHMKDGLGNFLKPPPSYSPIFTTRDMSQIPQFFRCFLSFRYYRALTRNS
ncbi:protein N-terminal glutamine amidohydrolase-like isoform X2 [Gordionus sp. m RMFG-2023]|uniref:protein N-terminal glutamine amidohydrolase-like isoform X2 n=1 Tax=Gordionus sp. m RMFG-2023 TaxID=3053472 RepID=UPI0031FD2EDE